LSSCISNNDRITDRIDSTKNDQSIVVGENKWIKISKDIQCKAKSIPAITTTNSFDGINNKWAKITDTINPSSSAQLQKANKRTLSPNISNKWARQAEKLSKQVKK